MDLKAEKAELERLDQVDRAHTVEEAQRSRELAQRIRLQENYGIDPDKQDR